MKALHSRCLTVLNSVCPVIAQAEKKKIKQLINFYHSLGMFSRWQIVHIFFFLFYIHRIGFDIYMQTVSLDIICMKCQNLFSGKNKKNISRYQLLKFLHSVKHYPLFSKLLVTSTDHEMCEYLENMAWNFIQIVSTGNIRKTRETPNGIMDELFK